MQNCENGKVLIVGDVMLDRYYCGDTERISPEAPVPIVRVLNDFCYPGGAGNVALNIAALKGQVSIIGLVGHDETNERLQKHLKDANIATEFHQQNDHPTITKLRILSQNQQILRLDFEQPLTNIDKTPLHQKFDTLMSQHDVLVLSDYGKGTLSDPQTYIQKARSNNIPVLVDPKGSCFEKYRGATLITPNFNEFTGVVGECPDTETLNQKGLKLLQDLDLEALLVTRGSEGMTLIHKDKAPISIPTRAIDVYDVTGAGDTVIGVFALAIATGENYENAMEAANAAAGIVVGKVGSATATPEELHQALITANPIQKGVLTKSEAQEAIKIAQKCGDKVVFTNGCFDLLHAGHITYLKEAKEQGDMLIVAVNTDESVKQIKGETRPIVPLQERMEMLASLKCVDWVVPFEEETSEPIIKALRPDCLVKGGDYAIEEIVGYDYVLSYGGSVKSLTLREGLSTTSIIEKIQK